MKTIIWIISIVAVSTILFSATVNAAYALAENLGLDNEKISIGELATR